MMRWVGRSAAFAALLTGCSMCRGPQVPPPPPPPAVYHLCLEASEQLNQYEDARGNSAHTLFVKVFQLETPDAFVRSDVAKLLGSDVTLGEGAPVERTLHPGKTLRLDVPRQPNAGHLGIVAGYYRLEGAGKITRPIPSDEDLRRADEEHAEAIEDDDEKKTPPVSPPTDGCIRFEANQIVDPRKIDTKAK